MFDAIFIDTIKSYKIWSTMCLIEKVFTSFSRLAWSRAWMAGWYSGASRWPVATSQTNLLTHFSSSNWKNINHLSYIFIFNIICIKRHLNMKIFIPLINALWLHELCLEVIIVQNNKLCLFWAKTFSLLLLLITSVIAGKL